MSIAKAISYFKSLIENRPVKTNLSIHEKLFDWWAFIKGKDLFGEQNGEKYDSRKIAINFYERFILLLLNIKNLNLKECELCLIESKLDSLDLQKRVKNKRRYIAKRLKCLEKYLLKKHSIIQKDYYSVTGMVYGSFLGCLLIIPAVVFSNSKIVVFLIMIIGFGCGCYLGLLIGRKMDAKAIKENRVLLNYYYFG